MSKSVQPHRWIGYLVTNEFVCISSVQFSRSVVSDSLRPHESQHASPPCPSPTPGVHPPCPSPTPGVHPDSCASSQWCHPAISSSLVPFSSCPQSFPASGSFQMLIFVFWMLSFKPSFSLSIFTFIKRLLSSSSLSAIRVVSSAYLRLFKLLVSSGNSVRLYFSGLQNHCRWWLQPWN